MKYQGKITDPLDLVTKQYVDGRSGVKSVNSKTGDVVLTAVDVGALSGNTTLADLTGDSTHRTVTDSEKTAWDNKQASISDLETIRSGASLGATAVQPASLNDKLDKNQGASNVGKFLTVGSDGNITLTTLATYGGEVS